MRRRDYLRPGLLGASVSSESMLESMSEAMTEGYGLAVGLVSPVVSVPAGAGVELWCGTALGAGVELRCGTAVGAGLTTGAALGGVATVELGIGTSCTCAAARARATSGALSPAGSRARAPSKPAKHSAASAF